MLLSPFHFYFHFYFYFRTCAYAPYAPNWLKTNGFIKFMWPAICCIRRNCRSLSVSANFTTKLEDAPYQIERRGEKRNRQNTTRIRFYYTHTHIRRQVRQNFFNLELRRQHNSYVYLNRRRWRWRWWWWEKKQ